MKIGEKVNFIQNGQSYIGAFLEEQPHLFDKSETFYRISISDSEMRRSLGLTIKNPLIISSYQVFKDEKSKQKALKRYPCADIKSELILKSENTESNNDQIDMFEEADSLLMTYRPKIKMR